MKTILNGKEVEHKDVILHTTITKFGLLDRLKILFGKKVFIDSRIYTDHDHCITLGSESTTRVDRIFKPKKRGYMSPESPLNKEQLRDMKINQIIK